MDGSDISEEASNAARTWCVNWMLFYVIIKDFLAEMCVVCLKIVSIQNIAAV